MMVLTNHRKLASRWSCCFLLVTSRMLLLGTGVVPAAAAATTTTVDAKNYAPAALQSGPDLAGSTFAAGAAYDPVAHAVVITGSTYGRFFETTGDAVTSVPRRTSSCFLASVALPSAVDDSMRWSVLQTVASSEDAASEACAACLFHERYNKLIVAGQSERGGFAESLYDDSQYTVATQYGLLLEFNTADPADTATSHNKGATYQLAGGRALQFSRVSYPVALASSPADDYVYVAAQETNSVQRNDASATTTHAGEINDSNVASEQQQLDPMRYFVYGANYRLSIGRYRVYDRQYDPAQPLQETFAQEWKKLLATDDNAAVHVAGIAEIDSGSGVIVVVGTTDGTGEGFGGSNTIGSQANMDGFVSKFRVDTGEAVAATGDVESSRRIQSIDGRDDWIAGLCRHPDDPDYVYIVGASAGDLTGAGATGNDDVVAYAMKLKVSTLETVWTTPLGAVRGSGSGATRTQVRGISCALSPDGDALWWGGVVQDGAVLADAGTLQSYGGNDVFAAKLLAEDGSVQFVRQLGSEEDDGMAMRGGLVVDRQGNAVVVGNTYGSFYRTRAASELEDQDWISDVFVATISGHDGSIAVPVKHPEFKDNTAPTNTNQDLEPPQPPNGGHLNDEPIQAPAYGGGSNDKGGMGAGGIAFFAILLVGIVATALFVKARSNKLNRDVTTGRSKVIHFLNEFDVEDVDLKQSATGGWHCSYSNDLANGRNRRAEREASVSGLLGTTSSSSSIGSTASLSADTSDPLMTAPLTNSSVLRDSLFMDDDDNDGAGSEWGEQHSLRGGGGRSRFSETATRRREGYDGLMEAYNASFNARQADDEDFDDNFGGGSRTSRSAWGKEIL